MTVPFFRNEALAHQSQPVYGQITLAQPLNLAVMVTLSVLVGAALVAYVIWGNYTRKVQIQGLLVPTHGVLKIVSAQSGQVVALRVAEGQSVKRGDVLMEISTQRSIGHESVDSTVEQQIAEQLALKQRSLESERTRQQELLNTQSSALIRRAGILQAEIAQVDEEIAIQKNRTQIADRNFERHEALVAQNFISAAQLQQHQVEKLEQQSRLQQLQRSRLGLNRELASVHNDQLQAPLRTQAELSTIARGVADITQQLSENSARRSVQIIAPHDGVITGLTAASGTTIAAGVPLASLIPANTQLQAHLFAPSQAVGFIEQGQQVMLRYAAYPYQKFGHQSGKVLQVSKTSLTSSEAASGAALTTGSSQNSEPLYRVTVSLDSQTIQTYGKPQPLLAGMSLDASVLQEKRKLWEWVLDPIYSISGKV
jgi:membrane fusion protein